MRVRRRNTSSAIFARWSIRVFRMRAVSQRRRADAHKTFLWVRFVFAKGLPVRRNANVRHGMAKKHASPQRSPRSTPTATPVPGKLDRLIPLLLVLAGTVAYFNSFRAPFVFDDR